MRHGHPLRDLAVLAILLLPFASSVPAHAEPPAGFSVRTIVRGLDSPTAFAYAPDGRIFITGKSGIVSVSYRGKLHTFLDLQAEVNRYSDRGLLSIALDPSFQRTRRVYLLFTEELRPNDPDSGDPAGGKLIRIEASRRDPTMADPTTRVTLLSGFKSIGPWHSVGGLDFDERGRLLVGFGDGSPYCTTPRCQRTGVVEPYEASAYAPFDLNSLSGKILRIDPETGHGVPDNPYYDPGHPDRVSSKVLARGVRTPFRINVDRTTGEILVGDVGTDQWDEINAIPTSWNDPRTELNFGWPCYEGGEGEPQPVREGDPYCVSNYYDAEQELTTPPWLAYPIERGAALILGPRYRGSTYPSEYVGDLFVGDWKRDEFLTVAGQETKPFGTIGDWGRPVDIDVSPRGNVAYVAIGSGQLNEILYVGGDETSDGWSTGRLLIAYGAVFGALLGVAFWLRRRRSRPSA